MKREKRKKKKEERGRKEKEDEKKKAGELPIGLARNDRFRQIIFRLQILERYSEIFRDIRRNYSERGYFDREQDRGSTLGFIYHICISAYYLQCLQGESRDSVSTRLAACNRF